MVYILGEKIIVNAKVKQNGQNIVYQLLYLSSKVFVSVLLNKSILSYSMSSIY